MATVPRLFVVSDLTEHGIVAITKEQAHYLLKVMRLKSGDGVLVFNGRHGEWHAVIDEILGKTVLLKAQYQIRPQMAVIDLTLMFAPLKKTRTDFVVEKATELGARIIQPVMTARTQADKVRTDRLSALVMEAAEQTERLDVPEVMEPEKLFQAVQAYDAGPLFFCDEAGDPDNVAWGGEMRRQPPFQSVLGQVEPGPAAILTGPEGGFTPEERLWLLQQEHVHAVSLGPRILRAETAALAAITIWQSVLGDWR